MSRRIVVEPTNETEAQIQADKQARMAAEEEAAQAAPAEEIPEKYRGKSVEEVIRMHQEAEKALGRKNNEIGQWRDLTNTLVEAKREKDLGIEAEESTNVSSDELFDNPTEAIRRVVARELEGRLAPVEQNLQQSAIEREFTAFKDEHPDFEQVASGDEFQSWVAKSRGRVSDATRAAQGDLNAARRLLEDFKELQSVRSAASPAKPKASPRKQGVDAARAVATESGGSAGHAAPAKVWTQDEIVEMMIRQPSRYNDPGMQSEIKAAFKEGRVRGL